MLSKSEPLPEGTVIMADDQYAGRGQQGNKWISRAGCNLTFSIYLKPFFLPVDKQFMLNIAVSIGINNALRSYMPDGIKIKWPNDVYFDDKKIGGVLIENIISAGNIKSTIIGIGINVNQRNYDGLGLNQVSSLGEILQQDVDLNKLLAQICKCIEVEYLKLRSGDYDLQHDLYLKDLYKFGEKCTYRDGENTFEGKIINVTKTGLLMIDVEGERREYGFKEIEFLNKK